VSRVGGRENIASPEDQELDAKALAERLGLQVGEVFRDIDKSGGTLDRPGLQSALARVENGASGGVVVAYLSRLTRETSQGLGLLERVRAAGGAVYAPNLPPDWTTADGKMITTIQLAIDAGYRERKTEELERAKAGAIARGIPISNRAPVGYYKDPATRTLVPDPQVAPLIRQAFEMRAAGDGPTKIAEFLDQNGVRTSQQSSAWSKAGIMGLIHNRVYLGEVAYGKKTAAPGAEPRHLNRNAHQPIVSPTLWARAQNPSVIRPVASRSLKGQYVLTGVLRCAHCGYTANATTSSRGKRIYRCPRRNAGGLCPHPWTLYAEPLEELVDALFWQTIDDLIATGTQQPDEVPKQLVDAVATALASFEGAQRPEVQIAVGQEAWLRMLAERRATLEEAERQVRAAEAVLIHADTDAKVISLRGKWATLSPAERRQLIAARFDAFALGREEEGFVLGAWPAGTAPAGLSRRGFRKGAGLRPFDLPSAPIRARIIKQKS
jgi:DNA invertase Pin-like site-specific DNA recombinase